MDIDRCITTMAIDIARKPVAESRCEGRRCSSLRQDLGKMWWPFQFRASVSSQRCYATTEHSWDQQKVDSGSGHLDKFLFSH